jgi:hypothetical protein
MKPDVTVTVNKGNYQTSIPSMTKLFVVNGVATAGEYLNAGSNPAMPVTGLNNAPCNKSFLNKASGQPRFRVCRSDYTYPTLGSTGSSVYYVYDPTGTGWVLKGQQSPMNPPFNPYAMVNIDHGESHYLVVADYDSAGDVGGTLCLVDMDVNDNYCCVASLNIPNKTSGVHTYQARVQDVHVDGSRIFVLVIYYVIDTVGDEEIPPDLEYLSSEVREYGLTASGANIAFSQVGPSVDVGKNAVSLVPYADNGNKYLFMACIGGMQNYGSNNGADSSLSYVDVTSGIGSEMKSYIGGATAGLHDFRSVAIAGDGTVYIMTGDDGAGYGMNWTLYKDTVANLLSRGASGTPGTIPPILKM